MLCTRRFVSASSPHTNPKCHRGSPAPPGIRRFPDSRHDAGISKSAATDAAATLFTFSFLLFTFFDCSNRWAKMRENGPVKRFLRVGSPPENRGFQLVFQLVCHPGRRPDSKMWPTARSSLTTASPSTCPRARASALTSNAEPAPTVEAVLQLPPWVRHSCRTVLIASNQRRGFSNRARTGTLRDHDGSVISLPRSPRRACPLRPDIIMRFFLQEWPENFELMFRYLFRF